MNANEIYTDGSYIISSQSGRATLTKALMFWNAYESRASLVIVRLANEKEKIGLVGWYAENLHIELYSIPIDRDSAQPLFQKFQLYERQGNAKHTLTQESTIWYLTDGQWDAFIAADQQALDDLINRRAAARKAEEERIERCLKQAAHTGTTVEIERYLDECDGTQPDCCSDVIIRSITGSGNIITTRTHGY
jgi:hypothetical protein